MNSRDEYWMRQAMAMAQEAKRVGEVPVGAVLVRHDGENDELIAQAYNCPITTDDPSAHAEIVVLRKGAAAIQNYRLLNTTLYVTLEPCLMCAGAMVHARIKRLVYGAADPKAGVITSMMQALDYGFLNHHIEYTGNLLAEPCGQILSDFFRSRR